MAFGDNVGFDRNCADAASSKRLPSSRRSR
jgi:hypothetical protein